MLIAVQPDPRLQMQKSAIEVARQYELEAKERLRRISLLSAGLEVVGKRQPPLIGRGVEETWYDGSQASEQAGAAEA